MCSELGRRDKFRQTLLALPFALTVSSVGSNIATAQETELPRLSVAPERCVVMNQGQACHTDTKIHWQVKEKSSYCILANQTKVKCWQHENFVKLNYSFVSTRDIDIQLINSVNNEVVAEAKVVVAWVFKKNQRRSKSWRMF